MYIDFDNPTIENLMLEGEFGLEKESLRVTRDGFLAKTNHPFAYEKDIDKDFCESQLEMITSVHTTPEGVCKELGKIHDRAKAILSHQKEKEYIWPFSNPCYIDSDDDIRIAHFEKKLHDKEVYREYLACKYGKRKMLFSGIHLNYSVSEELFKSAYENEKNKCGDYREFVDKMYLDTSYRLLGMMWFITLALSSSPVMDETFVNGEKGKSIPPIYRSYRCSKDGYYNDFDVHLSYNSIDSYCDVVEQYIEDGRLYSLSELYYPVRVKPSGDNTLANLRKGINHVEIRSIDLNPYSEIGIEEEDIKLIQLLFVFAMSRECEDYLCEKYGYDIFSEACVDRFQDEALGKIKQSVELNINGNNLSSDAVELLDVLAQFYIIHNRQEVLPLIDKVIERVLDPNVNYAKRVIRDYGESFVDKVMKELIENS